MKELLRRENNDKETALHEAVRVGNAKIVGLLMDKDTELASFPAQGGGASPMYLSYMLQQDQDLIRDILGKKSKGKFSISGQNGHNILHVAALGAPGNTRACFFFPACSFFPKKNATIYRLRPSKSDSHLTKFLASGNMVFSLMAPNQFNMRIHFVINIMLFI